MKKLLFALLAISILGFAGCVVQPVTTTTDHTLRCVNYTEYSNLHGKLNGSIIFVSGELNTENERVFRVMAETDTKGSYKILTIPVDSTTIRFSDTEIPNIKITTIKIPANLDHEKILQTKYELCVPNNSVTESYDVNPTTDKTIDRRK